MNITTTIKDAWYGAQDLRPYTPDQEILYAITPPGGEWNCVAAPGAVTRSVMWRRTEMCCVNPSGDLDDATEGQIAMGLRSTPVLDTALRVILTLSRQGCDAALIGKVAKTALAYLEQPAPSIDEPED